MTRERRYKVVKTEKSIQSDVTRNNREGYAIKQVERQKNPKSPVSIYSFLRKLGWISHNFFLTFCSLLCVVVEWFLVIFFLKSKQARPEKVVF